MRKLLVVLYTALVLGANPGLAGDAADLRQGDMLKLALHSAPVAVSTARFTDLAGKEFTLADYQGRWVVLNFWATWCAPCRHEMPSLDRLQAALPDLAVLPIASGRNAPEGIERFYAKAKIAHLPIFLDPASGLAKDMGVLGLPVTVILNPEGQEVGRLIGDADWSSENAVSVIRALMAGG